MEIILTNQCKSLTGSLGSGFGYFIVGRWSRKDVKYRYYSQRSRWNVPPDGHWLFIAACAVIATAKLHIEDINVSGKEVEEAITEAGKWCPHYNPKHIFHAEDILKLKKNLCL